MGQVTLKVDVEPFNFTVHMPTPKQQLLMVISIERNLVNNQFSVILAKHSVELSMALNK